MLEHVRISDIKGKLCNEEKSISITNDSIFNNRMVNSLRLTGLIFIKRWLSLKRERIFKPDEFSCKISHLNASFDCRYFWKRNKCKCSFADTIDRITVSKWGNRETCEEPEEEYYSSRSLHFYQTIQTSKPSTFEITLSEKIFLIKIGQSRRISFNVNQTFRESGIINRWERTTRKKRIPRIF